MDAIQLIILVLVAPLALILVAGFTWLMWTGVVEGLRLLATWILAREAERVMSLVPGPERSERAKKLMRGLSRFDAATSSMYIPSAKQRAFLLAAYVLVLAVVWLGGMHLQTP